MHKNLLFHSYKGSYVYGTYIEGVSDKDEVFVYYEDLDNILGNKYVEQINVNKDTTGYELGRFLHLLKTANPSMLEILYTPEDKIIYKHPIMNQIIQQRNLFLTKECKNSFGGYAVSQIKKAKGLDKKIHWEKEKTERKTVLDFCYVPFKQGSIKAVDYLATLNIQQEYCGLTAIPHMKNMYALYYDKNIKFKGIVQDIEKSNNISLSSIPKDLEPLCHMTFNIEGYSSHCKKYREYVGWLKERNTQRYIETKKHGQLIDSKNMSHCIRLIRMSGEIVKYKTIFVKRDDAEYLLEIRKGKYNLDELLQETESMIKENDTLFDNSDLPDLVDEEFVNDLLIRMRKELYSLK